MVGVVILVIVVTPCNDTGSSALIFNCAQRQELDPDFRRDDVLGSYRHHILTNTTYPKTDDLAR